MVTKTLKSNMIISFDDLGSIMEEGWDENIELPEFEKSLSYRRYDLADNYDNNTGDIDKRTYVDYPVYGEVQPVEILDKVVKSGKLQIGDAIIFLPARIRHTDGVEFRPQLNDTILWKGIRYRIDKMTYERIGQFEIYVGCSCKKVSNYNPAEVWNDNYDTGRGWS